MSDLFWPGDGRADDCFTDEALLDAMVSVEEAWLEILVVAGVAPGAAAIELEVPTGRRTEEWLAHETDATGNPAGALVTLLRDLAEEADPATATWLHRGLTSQDVLDSALMMLLLDTVATLRTTLDDQVRTLVALAREHTDTPMVARTLTQHAVPTTFGAKAAGWLAGVLDARDDLAGLTFPVQLGGAAGTMAAAGALGLDPASSRAGLAERLGLADAPAWHTNRSAVTRVGDALLRCTDAWGRIAADVLTLCRPEIGEVTVADGGTSSTMPGKANPIAAVLVRRTSLSSPALAATLHLCAATQVDERADGGWHAEWDTLRLLARRTVVAGHHTSDLVSALEVHRDRMATTLAGADVHAEQRAMGDLTGRPAGPPAAGDYLGETARIVDDVLARADRSTG